jgi:solute carrier family 25 phosphate transporter 23/24/25/41
MSASSLHRAALGSPSKREWGADEEASSSSSSSSSDASFRAHSASESKTAATASSTNDDIFTRMKKTIDGSRMVAAGGGAGVIARTASAPLDRIKLLFQVQAMASSGIEGTAYTGVGQAFAKIYREEGILSFWKGNGVNVIRVAPYAAAQLTSNDFYKSMLQDENGKLGVKERLLAGAMAGMTGTALTHPLDTIRLRLALPNHPYKGMMNAFSVVYRTEGVRALYKGLIPTLAGIAPYAACNFASYDVAKKMYYGDGTNIKQDPMANLAIGGASGTFSATVCYPLDTIRRRMQMKGKTYNGMADAMTTIMRDEGMRGFFRGWTANTMKVVPQNSIRFVAYELLKTLLGCEQTKI